MANFKNMLKNKNSAEKLRKKLEEQSAKKSFDDPNLWKYKLDKDGTAYAIIRFLPASPKDIDWELEQNPDTPEDEVVSIRKRYDHAFKQNGKWFISTCPTTWGEDCPVCEFNSSEIEKTGLGFKELPDSHKTKIAVRNRSRKEKFFANILVIKDKANPENEGKVFVFEFGRAVYNHIESKLFPKFEDETPIDVTSFTEGCNFKLRVYKDDQNRAQYDKCQWENQSPISEDEDELLKIWESEFALHEYVDESVKRSYEDMNKHLSRVIGTSISKKTIEDNAKEEADELEKTVVDNTTNETNNSDDDLDDEMLAALLED
jgi:hypothetical protein